MPVFATLQGHFLSAGSLVQPTQPCKAFACALQERVAQCEKAKNELLLQQALMQQSAGLAAGPSQLLANARLFQPSPLGHGIVQGVAVGLPALKVSHMSRHPDLAPSLSVCSADLQCLPCSSGCKGLA